MDLRFQSIGVTKEWRLENAQIVGASLERGFQSLGVTKDWRPSSPLMIWKTVFACQFPINRRHQRLATLSGLTGLCDLLAGGVSNQ